MLRKMTVLLALLSLLLVGCMGSGRDADTTDAPTVTATRPTAPKATRTPVPDEEPTEEPTEVPDDGDGSEGNTGSTFDLAVGDCFDETGDSDNIDINVLDCAEPHGYEVFHIEDLPEGAFPGDDDASAAASTLCEAAFEGYVGESYDTSPLYFSYYYPSKGTWADGDREVVCILHGEDGEPLTGSMAGSGSGESGDTGGDDGGTSSGEVISAFDLEVGHCFDYDSESGDVTLFDCGDPHTYEVFHLEDMPDGDFPGDEAVSDYADAACEAAFEGYVGVSYAESPLLITSLYPTEGTWAEGDREVVCILTLQDEPLVGSQQGAGTDSGSTISGTSNLEVGECFNKPTDPEEDIEVVECDEPHDHEVFFIGDLEGDTFPGDDETGDLAGEICTANFESYVGIAYEDSILNLSYVYPTAESWETGDREVLCLLRGGDEQLVGSMEGSGQ